MSANENAVPRRIRLTVAYDGTAYAGWQRQINAPSVQQTLEEALSRLTGETVGVTGASRTDAGVHALGQTAHFDTRSRIPPERFWLAVNTLLPEDIRVTDSRLASPAFHARYSARGKTYVYRIFNAPCPPVIGRQYTAYVPVPLDDRRMWEALDHVRGRHDFAAFAAAGGQSRGTVREISRAELVRSGNTLELTVSGRSFLYNMVRILAGSLIDVGKGKLPPEALKRALETGSRLDLGVTAPARGLTLVRVYYPEDGPIPFGDGAENASAPFAAAGCPYETEETDDGE